MGILYEEESHSEIEDITGAKEMKEYCARGCLVTGISFFAIIPVTVIGKTL